MGLFDWLFGSTSQPIESDAQPAKLARGRGFTFGIVGESHCQAELNSLCGGKCEDGHDLHVTAQLCFVEDNPHDPNAIAVRVKGQMVGFIPREDTSGLRAEILRLNLENRPVMCDAKIVGGWDRGDGDEGHYGVTLSLSKPLRLAKQP